MNLENGTGHLHNGMIQVILTKPTALATDVQKFSGQIHSKLKLNLALSFKAKRT